MPFQGFEVVILGPQICPGDGNHERNDGKINEGGEEWRPGGGDGGNDRSRSGGRSSWRRRVGGLGTALL